MSFSVNQSSLRRGVAIVTGGCCGLGRSITLHLAKAGQDVIITHRPNQLEAAAAAAAEAEALGAGSALLKLDLGDASRFEAFAAAVRQTLEARWRRPQFDFLINNAGVGPQPPAGAGGRGFREMVDAHFRGVLVLTRHLLPLMADGGRIVNTSSDLARFAASGYAGDAAYAGYAAHAAMKGAVEALTRDLGGVAGPRRIGVSAVAPGTDGFEPVAVSLPGAGQRRVVGGTFAVGRAGVSDDIGGVVALLCSEAGRPIDPSAGMFH